MTKSTLGLICGLLLLAPAAQAGPRVVFLYPEIASYLERAQSTPEAERTELYYQRVLAPHSSDCFAFRGYQPSHSDLVGMTSGNPAGWNFDQVRGELKQLERARSAIRASIERGIAAANKALPGEAPATICVLYYEPSNPVRSRMKGVMAYTANPGLLDLYVAPVAGWKDWIGYNMAHEFHHAAWMRSHPRVDVYDFTLLDYLVFEGRADRFASAVTGKTGGWTQALSGADQCRWYGEVKQHFADKGALLPQVMFGRGGRYPTWTGYTLGYGIVGGYLARHPSATVSEWTALEPAQILEGSSYAPCAG
jgi:uncharacterized protein YjaZ